MSITDLMFPKFCIGCHIVGSYICPKCISTLKSIKKDICIYCKKTSYMGLTHANCLKKYNIDGLVSLYHYSPLLKKIIKNYKYRLATKIFKEFLYAISIDDIYKLIRYKKLLNKALIQPIPLSKKRLNSRGFNQSLTLSKYFSQFLGLPVVDYLIRTKDNIPQAQLQKPLLRYYNTRGIFTLRPHINIKNKTILLVDDIITTGSTLKEACRVFKKNNNKVCALTLVKG